MARIVISDLYSTDEETFLHDLNAVQMNTLLGGYFESLLYNFTTTLLNTFQDDVNTLAKPSPVVNLDNNKFLTVDFSGLTINFMLIS